MKNKGTWIIVGIVVAFVLLIAGIFVTTNNRSHCMGNKSLQTIP